LKHFCKSYKRNRNQKREKKQNKKIYEKEAGETIWPSNKISPWPIYRIPEPVQPSLFHSLTSGPQLPVFFHLRPVTTLVTVSIREQ
jgi:hypothetical protein